MEKTKASEPKNIDKEQLQNCQGKNKNKEQRKLKVNKYQHLLEGHYCPYHGKKSTHKVQILPFE